MNGPYVHTLVNHFPVILMIVGCAVLALALVVRRRGLFLYALVTLTLAGLAAYPAFFTGNQAAGALRDTWYVVRSAVEEHDAAAGFALFALLLTGAVSAYGWWRMLRRDTELLPPVWLRVTTAIIAFWALSVVARTAYLGGKIVHDSPKLASPASTVTRPRGP